MSIITLITDFGNKDHFVAKMKGLIYTKNPDAKIVDISHNVSAFNIMEAAYILESSYKSFPENTVHIIDVDSEKTKENKHILIYLDNHFFISNDNFITQIKYPVSKYPQKIKSLKLEKAQEINAILKGIKGQYLIFENNEVFNVRSHEGFLVDFSFEKENLQSSLF